MKSIPRFALICSFAICATTPAAFAKKKGNKAPPAPASAPASAALSKYDKDRSGNLNVDESQTVLKDFAAKPKDPLLKPYDTNKDGVLSDSEIMAFGAPKVAPAQPKAKGKKGKK